ncbi:MAG: ABC transporter permease [Candidatus Omnitrophica bacterium]|nr:ABC transporter permease [Candidatus Omnitrophota bacterium]
MINLFRKSTSNITAMLVNLGGLALLGVQSFFWMFVPPFSKERFFTQNRRIGYDSLPIVLISSLFIGIILALQTAVQMQRLGSEMYIASIVALSIVRELGPVITAFVVAGRVGAAITAELGTMNVTEQVDALQTLAANPVKYLVVPRLLALMCMLPILTLYANIIGIFGGYMICVYKLGISSSLYMSITWDSLLFKDLFSGLMKSVIFAAIIALEACYEGLKVKGGAEGVGKATTASVVTTFVMIIAADCLLTALFYFVMG